MRSSSQLPKDLVALASQFDAWRQRRPHQRARFPDALVAKAVAAARAHTVGVTARGLSLDRSWLRKALARATSQKRAVGAAPRRTSSPKMQARKGLGGPAAVRMAPLVVAPVPTLLRTPIEIENRAGEKLRLDATTVDIAALIKSFLEDKR